MALGLAGNILRTPLGRWSLDSARRWWTLPLIFGVILAVCLFPFDGQISGWARSIKLGGDLKREFEAQQQFGQLVSLVLIAIAIWLVDAKRRERLWDFALSAGLANVLGNLVKVLVGRPRPNLNDPGVFLGPFAQYPVPTDAGPVLRYAWEWAPGVSYALGSMPSRHAVSAAAAATFLALVYPGLRPLCWILVGVVCIARVALGAHYPSDVIAGAVLGHLSARWVTDRSLGVALGYRIRQLAPGSTSRPSPG
jgi:undecaprenyl-diphosphatase